MQNKEQDISNKRSSQKTIQAQGQVGDSLQNPKDEAGRQAPNGSLHAK